MRGCSPLCFVISIRLYAARPAASAASITACGCPTNARRSSGTHKEDSRVERVDFSPYCKWCDSWTSPDRCPAAPRLQRRRSHARWYRSPARTNRCGLVSDAYLRYLLPMSFRKVRYTLDHFVQVAHAERETKARVSQLIGFGALSSSSSRIE